MKTETSIIILLIIIIFSCQEELKKNVNFDDTKDKVENQETKSNGEKILGKDNIKIPHVEVITANLPIRLDLIDYADKDIVQQISDGKMSGIEKEIKKFYFSQCEGGKGSPYSMNDIYLKTVQINNSSNQILYLIIFKHISGKINSKILFFDNTKKKFSEYVHDFNIHALYNVEDEELKSTNLKELFQVSFPEIDLVDFDGDEFADFKLRRLYHNGTANAIEEMIIEVNETKADTLKFEKKWMRN